MKILNSISKIFYQIFQDGLTGDSLFRVMKNRLGHVLTNNYENQALIFGNIDAM
jgi:hypothetical protein